ncbi:unnamed protein product [Rotaria sp. Silwood2]|nr:unnamed protein product [Rotaria sp. Silwood2]CAF3018229.1 unnamed protein product [Rotaria sp. Silwood2]CAF3367202.1 unnamed protein product [Rotaria sp. Silwood2]CAF4243060.1 unnamed protein product [Rotaria sp. Silwood2]CAF4262312.1 unnamed protein product [Rotaria sp. Silwood2]
MHWLNPMFHDKTQQTIRRPHELKPYLSDPPQYVDKKLLDRILGSLVGLALGDALGAHVEFRPHQYMIDNPVKDLQSGGTWGLQKGQFTDDTSMALCLAISLIMHCNFNPYDQLVRYKWWYKYGYMSSTGQCFDIGSSTRQALNEFERRQRQFSQKNEISLEDLDFHTNKQTLKDFDVNCGKNEAAGNGVLMRLAPVPLFFCRNPEKAVKYSGRSAITTHGDRKAYDACRFYGALIVAAIEGKSKQDLLHRDFYKNHQEWFGTSPLHDDVIEIAKGSYKKENGYADGIRGKGYVLESLKAALWAFWSDDDSFEKGVLAAVNLGDDTDTTAAIYGQLAGAYYGYKALPPRWVEHVYAKDFIICLSNWIAYRGEIWFQQEASTINTSNLQSKL